MAEFLPCVITLEQDKSGCYREVRLTPADPAERPTRLLAMAE